MASNVLIPQVQNAKWNSTEISLDLLPETTEEAAFLRSWRNSPYGGSARDVFALALQDDAAWVIPTGGHAKHFRLTDHLEGRSEECW